MDRFALVPIPPIARLIGQRHTSMSRIARSSNMTSASASSCTAEEPRQKSSLSSYRLQEIDILESLAYNFGATCVFFSRLMSPLLDVLDHLGEKHHCSGSSDEEDASAMEGLPELSEGEVANTNGTVCNWLI